MQSVSVDDVRERLLKRPLLSWWRKVYSDWEDDTSSGRAFNSFILIQITSREQAGKQVNQ